MTCTQVGHPWGQQPWTVLGRAHRGAEKTQLWLFFLCLFALGTTAGRSIPPLGLQERVLTAHGLVCVLISMWGEQVQPKTIKCTSIAHVPTRSPQCFLLSPLHFFSALLNTPFYSSPLGEKQRGEKRMGDNEMCENLCVGKGAFLGGPARHDPQGTLCCDSWPQEHCPG